MQKRYHHAKILRVHNDSMGKINQRFFFLICCKLDHNEQIIKEESLLGNHECYFQRKKSHLAWLVIVRWDPAVLSHFLVIADGKSPSWFSFSKTSIPNIHWKKSKHICPSWDSVLCSFFFFLTLQFSKWWLLD